MAIVLSGCSLAAVTILVAFAFLDGNHSAKSEYSVAAVTILVAFAFFLMGLMNLGYICFS